MQYARSASDQQHMDTLTALSKTDISVAALKRQTEIMGGQLDEMRFGRRPWVTMDSSPDDLDYNENGIQVGIQVVLRNTGVTPAMNVIITLAAFPILPSDLPQEMNKICSADVSHPGMGVTVFPGDHNIWRYQTYITKEKAGAYWATRPLAPKIIFTIIAACIVYQFHWASEAHHTPFLFNVRRVRGEKVPGRIEGAPGIFVDEGHIPASDLQLFAFPAGIIPAD
jgi:hypothetical protein